MVRAWTSEGRRQRLAAEIRLPAGLARSWQRSHPEVDTPRPALLGLRQWLRIHPIAPDAVGNPSMAVDEMWKRLINDGDFWGPFQREAYRRSQRSADAQVLRREAARRDDEALALTYAMGCVVERTRVGSIVTRVFATDRESGLQNSER